MSLTDEQIAHALELFDDVPHVTTRKMFGGLGIYSDGSIFAVLMSDGTIWIKGNNPIIPRYESLGMVKWIYRRPGQKASSMPYWALPEDMLDDPQAASALAREALLHL